VSRGWTAGASSRLNNEEMPVETVASTARHESTTSIAAAAAGPLGVGGVLALRLGDLAPMIAVPAVVFAVAALTLPALYIATAAFGAAPPIAQVMRAVGKALCSLGLVYAGVALPLLFLGVSSSERTAFALGAVTVAVGAGIGLRRLYTALYEGAFPVTGRGKLFWTWAAITLVIGARLFSEMTAEVVL
jgi:hypothetical protein